MDHNFTHQLLIENENDYRQNIGQYLTCCQLEHCDCPQEILSKLKGLSREYYSIVGELYGTQSVNGLKKLSKRFRLNNTQEEKP